MEHAGENGTVSTALVLTGVLDVRRTADVRARIYHLIAVGTGDVVVDISRVESVDMTTLKMLAVANRVAEREARRVVLRGTSPSVRRLLHLSHMRWMIPIEPTETMASPTAEAAAPEQIPPRPAV